MKKVRDCVQADMIERGIERLKGPLLAIVHYQIPAPKSMKGKQREVYHNRPHILRPDSDNLEKFLNDSLNQVAWRDDSEIVWTLKSKTYTQEPEGAMIIYLQELHPREQQYDELLTAITNHIKIA